MHPYLYLFGRSIDAYSLFMNTGYCSVPIILLLLKKHYEYSAKKAVWYSILTLLFGLASAYIAATLKNSILVSASDGTFTPHESKSSFGLYILVVFYLIFCLFFRKDFRTITDYIAPSVALVNMFVKIGCTFHGCCYGPPDPNGIYNESLGYNTMPIQIYDSLCNCGIFILCIILTFTFSKKHKGYIMPISCMLYALEKAYWENFRDWPTVWEDNFLNSGFTFWQFWLFAMVIGCTIWIIGTIICDVKGLPDFDKAKIHLPDLSKPAKKATTFIKQTTETLFGKIVEQILQK